MQGSWVTFLPSLDQRIGILEQHHTHSLFDLLFPLHLPGHPKLLLPRSHLTPFPVAVPGNEDGKPESLEVNRWEAGKQKIQTLSLHLQTSRIGTTLCLCKEC